MRGRLVNFLFAGTKIEVMVDLNGNAVSDFEIQVNDATAGDFVL